MSLLIGQQSSSSIERLVVVVMVVWCGVVWCGVVTLHTPLLSSPHATLALDNKTSDTDTLNSLYETLRADLSHLHHSTMSQCHSVTYYFIISTRTSSVM